MQGSQFQQESPFPEEICFHIFIRKPVPIGKPIFIRSPFLCFRRRASFHRKTSFCRKTRLYKRVDFHPHKDLSMQVLQSYFNHCIFVSALVFFHLNSSHIPFHNHSLIFVISYFYNPKSGSRRNPDKKKKRRRTKSLFHTFIQPLSIFNLVVIEGSSQP